MEKVIVIGCPGSGKSTFARKLRDATGLPLYHLDMIWHRTDRSTLSREEFNLRLGEILSSERWIIDGNYRRTMETRMLAADTVFFLDFPTEVCLAGAKARIGTVREDLPFVEHELDADFEAIIKDFHVTHLPLIYELLRKYAEKSITIFHSREETEVYLSSLTSK